MDNVDNKSATYYDQRCFLVDVGGKVRRWWWWWCWCWRWWSCRCSR